MADYLAAKDKLPIAEVRGRLGQLLAVLELVDRIELSHRTTPGQVVFTVEGATGEIAGEMTEVWRAGSRSRPE